MNRTINKVIKYTFSTPSSLLTWGETTYGWARPINNRLREPGVVESFNDVTQVATGPYHILFTTSDNNVFSAGLGNDGRLGINSIQTKDTPEMIQQLNGLQIKQLSAGLRHSLALTKCGKLYSWGYGGSNSLVPKFMDIFQRHSPIGHGFGKNVLVPTLINHQSDPITHATAGDDFSLALTQQNILYGWGQGMQDLFQEASSYPRQLQQINFNLNKNKNKINKMKAVGRAAYFLLSDGRIYVIGQNNGGFFGTRNNPNHVTDNFHRNLVKVIDSDYKDQHIVNFEVSGNSLIFITDQGSVFYSGMHSKFRPEPFPTNIKAKSIFATYDSVGIIAQDQQIYYINDQFIDDSDVNGNLIVSTDPLLHNGVLQIGGTYKLRYALVRN